MDSVEVEATTNDAVSPDPLEAPNNESVEALTISPRSAGTTVRAEERPRCVAHRDAEANTLFRCVSAWASSARVGKGAVSRVFGGMLDGTVT
ncbi:hypothetical protein ColTof4_07832 [Colletotrichum tofieldiae]|nr:hypothetical protein ColTof3_02639 [Colletotrichum tofieldiae]GKT75409.1 hypothetical protein ColTof4_07832 [Colletotrichum tofieldiae]